MEEIEETLTQLLEEEAGFLTACSDYLHDKREKRVC